MFQPSATMGFRTLDDWIGAPPWGAVVTLLFLLGNVWWANRLAGWVFRERVDALHRAGCFGAVCAVLGAITHALAGAGSLLPLSAALRGVGALVLVPGLVQLLVLGRSAGDGWQRGIEVWRESTPGERLPLLVCGVIAAGLGFSALGPVTDADSLAYHVGVPVEWLRAGRVTFRPDWFETRLVGIGECLNLLGLALGAEQVGAGCQGAGVAMVAVGVTALAPDRRGRMLGLAWVLTTPLLVFLVPNQKHMLLPAGALMAAGALLVRRTEGPARAEAQLAVVLAVFAVAAKLSFLLSAWVVGALALFLSWRAGFLWRTVGVAAIAICLLLVPRWVSLYRQYGDPWSPFLERFRATPDPAVLTFAALQYDAGGSRSWKSLLRMPWDFAIPGRLGDLGMVLGLGVWAWWLGFRARGRQRWLALAAGVAVVSEGFFAPRIPRFFLDPHFWLAGVVVGLPLGRVMRTTLLGGLTVQGVVVAAMSCYGAVSLGIGGWSARGRTRVMERAAYGYLECRWMDRVLPAGAKVLAPTRSRSLIPRPFVVGNPVVWRGDLQPAERLDLLIRYLKAQGVTAVVYDPERPPFPRSFRERHLVPLGEVEIPYAARNPFNRNVTHRLAAARMVWDAASEP
ncbi:MAG: DUF1420 family protein [Verrucomicrobiota bacterium]